MEESLVHSGVIDTREWNSRAALLNCPRCGQHLLHHSSVTVFDREEDGKFAVKTKVSGANVSVEPRANGVGNPSARRDGIVIDFWCEGCGEAPLQLTLAQHKGSTEIGWRYADEAQTD